MPCAFPTVTFPRPGSGKLCNTLTSFHSLYVSIMLAPRTEDFPMQPTQVHNSVAFTPTSYPIPSRAPARARFQEPVPNKTGHPLQTLQGKSYRIPKLCFCGTGYGTGTQHYCRQHIMLYHYQKAWQKLANILLHILYHYTYIYYLHCNLYFLSFPRT